MRNDLKEWEASLKPYFNHIKLLGEIPITHIEVDQIGNLIRDLNSKYSPTRTTRILEADYPRTFSAFLASLAAHNTARDYWRVVAESTGVAIQRINQLSWGSSFLRILEEFELPTFQDIGGYRYVNPIRLHGGIPAYSLPDFFAYILWPSVTKTNYKELPSEDLVTIILKRASIQILVDSPVTNFLENGGEYAIEFFDRCRKMARTYNQSQELPDPIEIDLPPYVVRTFQQYIEEELETETGRRLRKPQLLLDPWGPDFYIHIPPEPVDALLATRQYLWHVEMQREENNSYEHSETVRVRRRGYEIETSEVDIPLENPAQRIITSYCMVNTSNIDSTKTNTNTIHRWRLNLLPTEDQPPLLVFNPNNGRILNWNQALPATELWLLSPIDVELKIDGEGEIVENFPDFYGSWGQWTVEAWDLSNANSIQLIRDGKEIKAPIPIQSAPPDPILIGENTLRINVDPDEVPVYIGDPPWIRIPLRPGRTAEAELAQWQLKIESRWAASPEFHHDMYKLSDFKSYVTASSNEVDFPLASVLGPTPCGTYRAIVTGPFGLRAEFRFRNWPNLTLEGLESYYLPSKVGALPVAFNIELPQLCEVSPQAGVEGVTVNFTDNTFQVNVDPKITVADLHLISPLPDNDPIRLPISITIPRLRWSLLLGEDDSDFKWHANPIQTTVDALQQAEKAILYFELPLIDELPLILNVALVNPENNKVIQKHTHPKSVSFRQTRWRFPLGEFSDTIRQLNEHPVFEFQLTIENSITGEQNEIPVLRLNRTLDIHTVWIEFLEESTFCMRWIETNPLRNRRVRIWSEWQPWITPLEVKIPDDVRGELDVEDVLLQPSHYRMHFFTAAPWDPPNPPNEPPNESILVETTTPRERLKWIQKQTSIEGNHSIPLHFEHACLLDNLRNTQARDQEIKWCCQHINECTPDQILALHRWLGIRDPESQIQVRTFMYRPDQIQNLLSSYPKSHPKRDLYLEHFTEMDLVEPESALLVLDNVIDPGSVMHALIILIKQEHQQALPKIYSSIENGQLSDLDAGELLALHPDFTLPSLGKMPEAPLKIRMIQRMVKRIPDQEYFVLPKCWIQTSAGWGCIEEIRDQKSEEPLRFFNRREDYPLLFVILRPDHFPERISVDLNTETLTFLDASQVWICTKNGCYSFASAEDRHIINNHNRAAHLGLGPALRPLDPSFQMFRPVEYSLEPPISQFD